MNAGSLLPLLLASLSLAPGFGCGPPGAPRRPHPPATAPAACRPAPLPRGADRVRRRLVASREFERRLPAGSSVELACLAAHRRRTRCLVEVDSGDRAGTILLDAVHEGAEPAGEWFRHLLELPATAGSGELTLLFRAEDRPAAIRWPLLSRLLPRPAGGGGAISEPVVLRATTGRSLDRRRNVFLRLDPAGRPLTEPFRVCDELARIGAAFAERGYYVASVGADDPVGATSPTGCPPPAADVAYSLGPTAVAGIPEAALSILRAVGTRGPWLLLIAGSRPVPQAGPACTSTELPFVSAVVHAIDREGLARQTVLAIESDEPPPSIAPCAAVRLGSRTIWLAAEGSRSCAGSAPIGEAGPHADLGPLLARLAVSTE